MVIFDHFRPKPQFQVPETPGMIFLVKKWYFSIKSDIIERLKKQFLCNKILRSGPKFSFKMPTFGHFKHLRSCLVAELIFEGLFMKKNSYQ